MLPKGLKEIIESVNFVDCDFTFRNVNITSDVLSVEFSMNDTDSNENVVVSMTVLGNKDYFIAKADNSGYCYLENKHPLLWRFSDTQCELYITGQTKAIKELTFDLFNIHYSLFRQYLAFNLNCFTTLSDGFGLFQRGAKQLLKIYANKMKEYGIKTSIIGDQLPDKESSSLKILFLGNSYFIGDKFEFEICNTNGK